MNQKKQRTLAIFALAIALVATTVAYAALSTTLNISGNITKKGGSWSVGIANISNVSTTGTGALSTAPSVTGTTLSFEADLKKPGDSVSFTFDLVNNGSVDAVMSFNDVEFAINGVSQQPTTWADMTVVSDDIIYELAVEDASMNDNYISRPPADMLIYLYDSSTSLYMRGVKLTLTWKENSKITTIEDKKLKITASFPFKQA